MIKLVDNITIVIQIDRVGATAHTQQDKANNEGKESKEMSLDKPKGRTLRPRLSLSLNTREIADKMCVPYSVAHYWVTGQRVPSLSDAMRLRDVCGIPMETWLGKVGVGSNALSSKCPPTTSEQENTGEINSTFVRSNLLDPPSTLPPHTPHAPDALDVSEPPSPLVSPTAPKETTTKPTPPPQVERVAARVGLGEGLGFGESLAYLKGQEDFWGFSEHQWGQVSITLKDRFERFKDLVAPSLAEVVATAVGVMESSSKKGSVITSVTGFLRHQLCEALLANSRGLELLRAGHEGARIQDAHETAQMSRSIAAIPKDVGEVERVSASEVKKAVASIPKPSFK